MISIPAKVIDGIQRCERGAVAPMFGLMIIVLAVMAGVSIDTARAFRIASQATIALDAAALAAAKALRLDHPSDDVLRTLAEGYFTTNFAPNGSRDATVRGFTLTSNRIDNSIRLAVDVVVPTSFAAILGRQTMDVVATSTAVFDVKDIELSMMLDVSGSMSGSKIADLRAAAKDLVEIMMPADEATTDNRIAIAPFSTAVNAGDFVDAVASQRDSRGRRYSGANTTCVTDRPGTNAFKDAAPDQGKLGKKSTWCPASSVVPLTDDRGVLNAAIDTMQADGMTAGHLGISWAWYLLSPEWASAFPTESAPRAYDDVGVQKVALIMTDGMFNTAYESSNGDSPTQARKLCDNMKMAGVSIFTVGFQVPEEVVPILQYCATSPKHFFDARNGTELRETFQTIAKRLNGLRLAS